MKKRIALVCAGVCIALGCLFVVGCTNGSHSSGSSDSEDTVDITLKNGGSVTASGSAMTVSLDENASTGYTWVCEIADNGTLALTDDETVVDDSDEEMVGVGGTRLFSFEGKDTGTTEVSFTLGQQWDSGETSDDSFILEVTVEDKGQIAHVNEK